MCYYKGAESGMNLDEFLAECTNLNSAFPDLVNTYDSIKEVTPGVIRVQNYKSAGTHRKPYGFGPFPKVKPTNIFVEEDPCHLEIHVAKGKMTKFVIDIKDANDLVGPPGYYTKIGGKMTIVDDNASESSVRSKESSITARSSTAKSDRSLRA